MSHGYKYIRVNGKFKREHRYVWEQYHGPIPEGMQIDHINGDRKDNRIENLRLANQSDNSKNRIGSNANNKLGIRNVQKTSSGKYRVRLMLNGKDKHIGVYSDIELAELVAQEARLHYYGEFA